MAENSKKHYASIFNDVLAPVTQGPSSSNTVGPFRIGTIARALLKGEPVSVRAEMSTGGNFAPTFYGMESDKGLLTGLLGRDLIEDDLGAVYDVARERGLGYEFVFTDDIPAIPAELMLITLSSEEETLRLRGISLGGGEVLIDEINGEVCEINGIFEQEILVGGETRKAPSVDLLKPLDDAEPPFENSETMLKYAKDNGKEFWEAALEYEESLTGLSHDEILKIAGRTLDLAYRAIDAGYKEGIAFEGVTIPKTPEIREKIKNTTLIPTGIGDKGSLDALALMEYSNSHGIIVCMPTGGAAGIIPAAIRSASEALGKSRDDEIKALLTAGLIGVFYYPTHYYGALGCQAEVGIALSQAAGALASLITEDPEAVERAAVLGMQFLLGQVCDPVEGYAQLPCFIRNIASVPAAATCANYGVLGIDTAVSLDEMAGAVLRVGEAIMERGINYIGTCACCYKANPKSTSGNR